METWAPTLLIALLVVPLVGAAVSAVFGRSSISAARTIALVVVCVNFGLTVALIGRGVSDLIDRDTAAMTAQESFQFRPLYETKADPPTVGSPTGGQADSAVRFHIGLDGLNLWLVALT